MAGDKKIQVAMIVARFPPHVGGTERQALGLSRELSRQGVDVHVLTQYQKKSVANENIDGVHVHRLKPGGSSLLTSGLFLLNGLRWLLTSRPCPSIFHGHMIATPAVLACLARRLCGGHAIVKIACSGSYGEVATSRLTRLGRWKFNFILKNASSLVCVSKETVQEVVKAGASAERVVYIPNGVDVKSFPPAPSQQEKVDIARALGLPPGPWILFAGRMNTQKQPRLLVDSFLKIQARVPQARLLLLGEGPDENAIRTLVRNQGLKQRIFVRVATDNMADYYRMCDVFVLPSLAEGLSNSLLEAMSSGLVCIATKIGGNVDVVEDGVNGFLFSPGDSQRLSELLEHVLSPGFPRLPVTDSARERVMRNFSFVEVATQYHNLYSKLVANEVV